MVSDQP